ncbi:MAG: hypothetical protein KIS79_17120 [Burkholderiales bacterium]|nr:hypothetical protein [Burkholderiales bacterium]
MQNQTRTASFSRREFLAAATTLAAAAALPRATAAATINAPLLENEAGGYRVLPAGQVFCAGVVPLEGYEIVHALVSPWVPLREAWSLVEAHLAAHQRPMQALCGMELRIPEQLTPEGFRTFNGPYIAQLRKYRLIIGNYSAVCRTNVAPAADAPQEAMLHAFSYCLPARSAAPTFCVSGTADIDTRGRIVAEGDLSPAGMRRRLQHCIDVTSERLALLELQWASATHIDLCVARDIDDLIGELLVPALQGGARHGIRIHHARPPIVGAEVELECRRVQREIVISA